MSWEDLPSWKCVDEFLAQIRLQQNHFSSISISIAIMSPCDT